MQTKGGGAEDRQGAPISLQREKKEIVGCQSFGNVSKHGDLLVLYFLLSPFLQHDVL